MQHLKLFISASIIILLQQTTFSQGSILCGNLSPGKYETGLKIVNVKDTSRFLDSNKTARPLQILIWYPAERSVNEKPMLYKDYVALLSDEINFDDTSGAQRTSAVEHYIKLLSSNGVSQETAGNFLSSKTKAYLNAQPVKGSFPCLVVGQGNFNPAWSLSVLCEYLASHGYYVASCPSPTRITGPIPDTTQIYNYSLDQMKDMEICYKEMKNFKYADTGRLGIIGYSFGGRGAFLMLSHSQNVKAFVSLDGGEADKNGKHWLNGIKIDLQKITSPVIHFYQNDEKFVIPDFYLIDSLKHSYRILVKVTNMRHMFFSNMGMAVGTVKGLDFPGTNKDSVRIKTETVYKITLEYLNNYLGKQDDANLNDFINREAKGNKFLDIKVLNKKN